MALLAAGAAHELNNPLSVIVGYVSLILGGKTAPDRVAEQLQKVQAEAKHCRLVLESLSQLAEFNRGPIEPLDLTSLLHDVRDEVTELKVVQVGEHNMTTRGREHGLRLLFLHLLRNARESGARSLEIAASRLESSLRLQFQDDGAGLPVAAQRRAKEPFFSTKPGAVGLGLTMAELVVTAHGGSLELQSAPGGGTSAVVQLPLSPSRGELK
ncbi:MAG TPA: HAMP domain-containing sensor histidine kinase [Polyangiaceae bacterium]|nr:HAMP domain-containing sensor histidine kinase [Polyangiaceae bacterium]